jgi:hypothetical protein
VLTVTVTVFGFLIVIVPLVSRGTLVAANQIPPPFVDICQVDVAFQFPEAILLKSSLADFAVLLAKKKIVRTEKILSIVTIFNSRSLKFANKNTSQYIFG